jgi:hypothetical protein
MERAWLESRLTEERSTESIAKEVQKHPSTVAYWVKEHGLRSQHAPKHAARGGVARETLLELVERGLSVRQIGERSGWAPRASATGSRSTDCRRIHCNTRVETVKSH